jgi:hypothetical protein
MSAVWWLHTVAFCVCVGEAWDKSNAQLRRAATDSTRPARFEAAENVGDGASWVALGVGAWTTVPGKRGL